MAENQKTALFYAPEKNPGVRKRKGVLVRLGVRIRNVEPEQTGETVGALAGLPGYGRNSPEAGGNPPVIPEEMLVLCHFSGAELDRLLRELRKANASVSLKAVLTATNAGWSFYQLYQELCRERNYRPEK